MTTRATFDCDEALAVAYAGLGKHARGRVHVFPVPKPGCPNNPGVIITGEKALLELQKAVEYALAVAPRPAIPASPTLADVWPRSESLKQLSERLRPEDKS